MQSQVHPDQPPAARPATPTKQLPPQRYLRPAYSKDVGADLVDQGNGVDATVAVLPRPGKPVLQRVSDGTRTASTPQHPAQTSTMVYPTTQMPLLPQQRQPSSPPPPTTGNHSPLAIEDYNPPPRLSSLQQTPTSVNGVHSYPLKQQEQQRHQRPEQGRNHLNNHDLMQRGPELQSSPSLSTTDLTAASIVTSASSPASSVSCSTMSHTLHIPTAPAYHVPLLDSHAEQCSPHSVMQRPRPSSCSPANATDLSDVSTMSSPTTFAVTSATPSAVTSARTIPSVGATSLIYPAGQHPPSSLAVEQQQQQLHLQNKSQYLHDPHPELLGTTLPVDSTASATVIGTEAIGAESRYPISLSKMSSPVLTAPIRASTLDIRKTPPGSRLVGDRAVSSSRQQQISQGESSSRARRRQIYRRNTYSADLGSSSFPRSDDDMELDELEVARRRMDALKKSSNRRMSKRKKDDDNDRVLIGTRIGEDHVNYVLMYNMLTGIRVSVSRCNAKPQRALVDDDFTAAHKLAFDITGNELTPSSKYDFKFKDYAPWVFRHLREDFHIDASDYLVSLTSKYILSELGSPGKSGSFFYFSQDYRFIIKTIHHAEHKFMRKILKDYFNHVKHNPHTLLCRFFGLHRVKLPHGRKIHFVVMGNVFPPNRDIHETYDLKGSTLGRAISDEELKNNPRATQKDLNWVNRKRKLELGPEKRHLFVEQIKRDVELLARLNIMDYSLLVGIHDIERGNRDNIRDNTLKVFHPDTSKPPAKETSRVDKQESKANALRMAVKVSDPKALGPSTLPSDSFSERRYCIFYADDGGLLSTNEQNERGEDLYYLGIIDILTPYNYVKKIEHMWKSLSQDKHAISAVNPREYAQRFLSFMIHAIKINYDVLSVLEKNSHPHSD